MRFRVPKTMKRALFLKNGSINETYGLQIGKRLTVEDARKVVELLTEA